MRKIPGILVPVTLIALFHIGPDLQAQSVHTQQRDFLTATFGEAQVEALIKPRDDWRPFPRAGEAKWQNVPEAVRTAHIQAGEALRGTTWEPLPATVLLEYVRTGNRNNYQNLSFSRREKLAKLVLAEAMQHEGRFLDDILNGIWAISEETYWGVPAHLSIQAAGSGLPDVDEPTVDLFAAETGSLFAWTDYLLGAQLDALSPLIRERIHAEVDRRILTPNFEREDFWWMGFEGGRINNWNPWVNSNWLTMVLLLEKDASRRNAAVYKIMRSLDLFINSYPEDGGCDEGPGYWSRAAGSLFDTLEILDSASGGAINIFDKPLIAAMGQYIYKGYIADNYFVNFADASGKLSVEPALIYRYGKQINDARMMGFAAFVAQQQGFGQGYVPGRFGYLGRQLPALFILDDLKAVPPVEPLFGDAWLPDIQVLMAREAPGTREGFYLAAKGGHNDESHNHNDVGSFVVYHNGYPVLIDAGVGHYTAQTFSSNRYDIWSMQSAYHNLPTINGIMQQAGREFKADNVVFKRDEEGPRFQLNLSQAYPASAKVNTWQRSLMLHRNEQVELVESYELAAFVSPFYLSFITSREVNSRPGELILQGGKVEHGLPEKDIVMTFDPASFDVALEPIQLDDSRMQSTWGDTLIRIKLTSKKSALKGEYAIYLKAGG